MSTKRRLRVLNVDREDWVSVSDLEMALTYYAEEINDKVNYDGPKLIRILRDALVQSIKRGN